MQEELLKEIGLTDGEIRVYTALIELGKTSTGPLMKTSKISSSKIYLILERLIDKGLVSYNIENNVRFYENTSPKMILTFLEEKKKQIDEQKEKSLKLIKTLEKLQPKKEEDIAKVYRGIRGIQQVHNEILDTLKPNEEYLVIGAPVEAGERLRGYWEDHNKRRLKKKVKMKIIVNYNHPQISDFKSYKYTSVRVLDKESKTPSWIVVYRNTVIISTLTEKTVLFYLKNKATADSYKEFFKIMWNEAKAI